MKLKMSSHRQNKLTSGNRTTKQQSLVARLTFVEWFGTKRPLFLCDAGLEFPQEHSTTLTTLEFWSTLRIEEFILFL